MNALLMMIKSMGFDPEEFMGNVHKMGQLIMEMHASQVRTEAMMKELIDQRASNNIGGKLVKKSA